MEIFTFDLDQIANHLLRLLISFVLALPLGWNREKSKRHFGLRTFPLVAVVTCGFTLVGRSVLANDDAQARVIQGIITGIGFIGGGAVLTDKDKIKGTASAASIWNTGCIGLAVAYERIEIAVALSLLNFLTLILFSNFKEKSFPHDEE